VLVVRFERVVCGDKERVCEYEIHGEKVWGARKSAIENFVRGVHVVFLFRKGQKKMQATNATELFFEIVRAQDPEPLFEFWSDVDTNIFIEFYELLFQDEPDDYFQSKFSFDENRAYPYEPKRLDWILELAAALHFINPVPFQETLLKYQIWEMTTKFQHQSVK
jgi:hypothetical protein